MSFVNGLSMPWHNLVDKIDGKTFSKEYEAVEGMLDRCYISPYFITNQKNQKCVELDSSEKHRPSDTNVTGARCLCI
ncbi:uncharacterized protein LOC111368842 isoform X3 [Olea europaea var. sylvestris]|uniref:uncharacterized protein LOC111368842 isoform X3 n=1 Tax=Olea europaea var. sylvestris TaxID=158386 RepID=UPI000C1D0545|nr:uncharacterized protein LOC111368842 isoform X3 [Olea europaea var. sylvestris]